jgi:CofD-related protein of GAK system
MTRKTRGREIGRMVHESDRRVLFFSGGSALRGLARVLIESTHASRHIVTPFDSGGSSAELRRAFRMPAVGDLRNRVLALADTGAPGVRPTHDLLASRFETESDPGAPTGALAGLVDGSDARLGGLPEPARSTIRRHLGAFLDAMPTSFDLRGASVGNLVLAGAWLDGGRRLAPAVDRLAELVSARGIVRPVVDADLHVGAELADGRTLLGQHLLSGKVAPPLDVPVSRLFLSASDTEPRRAHPEIDAEVDGLVRTADLICYPVGSFWTSIVATLLPAGVADAIAAAAAPKVYVPNPGHDPEEVGMDLPTKVRTLRESLERGATERVAPGRLLSAVLVDAAGAAIDASTLRAVEALGVEVIDRPLFTETSRPRFDDRLLAEALFSLA